MIEVLILSSIQGITEFLPVSSSSHLILISEFIQFEKKGLSIDVSLHIGSFLAVLIFFREDIYNFFNNKELFLKILISSIPVMLFGFFLIQNNLIDHFRNIKVIGWSTLIFGFLLYFSDRFSLDKNIKENFDFKSAMIIGLFQILSLVPGVSRSGIVITAARLLNFERFDAAKISFLLSIPTLAAVSLYGIKNIVSFEEAQFSYLNIFCIFFSCVFSFITIKYFLKFIQKFSLKVFVIYRVILGIIILAFAYL